MNCLVLGLHLILSVCSHSLRTGNHSTETAVIPQQMRANSRVELYRPRISSYSIRVGNRSICRFETNTVPCECILEVSDSYFLEENGDCIAMFAVGPPDIQIQVPSKHDMLQNLDLHIAANLCISQEFKVELLYRAFEVIFRDDWKVVANASTILHTSEVHIVFSCENFANAGFYRVHLTNSFGYIVQSEQWILVNDTTSVSLQLRNDSIFPHCAEDYPVQWKTAKCDTAKLNYRLRVYAIPEGSINHEHRFHYIEEISISSEQSSLSVDCSQFDIFYEKYCFELISVHAISDVYHLWRSTCVNTEPVTRVHGVWGSWSAWSECSSTCGASTQKRHRFCEDPRPNRGKNCDGQVVETRPCEMPDCLELDDVHLTGGNCRCGCEMTGISGSFFVTATDARLCSGNQTWSMRRRNNPVVSDFKITTDTGALGELFFFLGAPYEDLVWFSGSNQGQELTLQVDRPIFVVLCYKGNSSSLKHRKGFTVIYSTRDGPTQFPVRDYVNCNPLCPETIVFAFLSILFLVVIFVPPFLWAKIIRRPRRYSIRQLPVKDKPCNSGMMRSRIAESTQAIGGQLPGFVSQRSIGVQLSVQNTPRFSRICLHVESPLPRGSSSLSTSDELEYDYYDGTTIPGSLLAPVNDHMLSVIDIDQIIGQSSMFFSSRVENQNAHTQI